MEDGDGRPTTLAKNTVEFLDPCAGIREVHQPHVANESIECLILKAKRLPVLNVEGRVRDICQALACALKHVRRYVRGD